MFVSIYLWFFKLILAIIDISNQINPAVQKTKHAFLRKRQCRYYTDVLMFLPTVPLVTLLVLRFTYDRHKILRPLCS
jgi:hypothetical protein